MPPDAAPRPSQGELHNLSSRNREQLKTAELARRAKEGRVVLRRLNRAEYTNTVRDLLGVELDLDDLKRCTSRRI
jgi:hypothetical protein